MRAIRPLTISTALVAGLALAACGADRGADDDRPRAAGYPVSVKSCDRTVTVRDRPTRIVSLNQGTTEILLSLGLADRMAGTATWTDPVLPSLAQANRGVERLADNAPSLEAVLDQDPDLVTASFTGTLTKGGVASAETFAGYDVPAYLSPGECGKADEGNTDGTRVGTLQIDTIYQEVRDLATLTGTEKAGDALVDRLKDRMAKASTKLDRKVRVAYWFANSEAPYMAGCCGGPGITSRALGVENVFADQKGEWPQISWEVVADRDPDVIVLGDLTRKSQTAETAKAKIAYLEKNPVTRQMSAVRNKRYVFLAGAELNPSIRTVDATEKVGRGLRDLGLAD